MQTSWVPKTHSLIFFPCLPQSSHHRGWQKSSWQKQALKALGMTQSLEKYLKVMSNMLYYWVLQSEAELSPPWADLQGSRGVSWYRASIPGEDILILLWFWMVWKELSRLREIVTDNFKTGLEHTSSSYLETGTAWNKTVSPSLNHSRGKTVCWSARLSQDLATQTDTKLASAPIWKQQHM